MIDRWIAELGEKLDLTAEELADIVWLTLVRQQGSVANTIQAKSEDRIETTEARSLVAPISPMPISTSVSITNSRSTSEIVAGIAPRRSQADLMTNTVLDRVPFKVPNPPSIREPLALVRSLRPLMRQVPSGQIDGLDEQATAQQIAETQVWQPIVQPALEPWLELVLVADESASMLIWQQTVLEFRKLLRNYGTFRDVQLWGLRWSGTQLELRPGIGSEALQQAPRQAKELLDPSGRRLILLITDCVAEQWHQPDLTQTLKLWAQSSPVAIAQVLPEWLWVRTAIRGFEPVSLTALEPGLPNSRLTVDWSAVWQIESAPKSSVCVPIVPLEPASVLTWSQMVVGRGEAPGYWVRSFAPEADEVSPHVFSPQERLERFQVQSSPIAQRLIGLVAASPVITLPVIRLIQETLLPTSEQMNVAEVILGGLLEPIEPLKFETNPDQVEYRFVDEAIRKLVLEKAPVTDTVKVLSKYIEKQFDMSLDEFVAELQVWSQSENAELVERARPFATVTAAVLKRKGRRYREFVQHIEHQYSSSPEPESCQTDDFPTFQEFEFETGIIDETLQPFEFTVATIELQSRNRRGPELVIHREQRQAWQFVEELSEQKVLLEMVSIPAGSFLMGSPDDDLQRSNWESPQHSVTVDSFFMGKYPISQVQWRIVAEALPQVKRSLDPDPSHFKGDDRPVEQVSWCDAIEFCDRLSRFTGKSYRLPTEAEWEYACRASPILLADVSRAGDALGDDTITPFHFGETITPELANYNGSSVYGQGVKGLDRKATTPVGSFGVANNFGLYDMHGNVWEWCQDHWHDSYEGAPTDGSAWIDTNAAEDASRVLRGGSWFGDPRGCRSASRLYFAAGRRLNYLGFRVVCSAPRTL
ncbi:SAV_2336 N-terminal domain-related protein [Phormidesmis sp. 146-12]